PHTNIVQGLDLHVKVQELQGTGLNRNDLGIRYGSFDRSHPFRRTLAASGVQFASDKSDRAGVVVGNVAQMEFIHRRAPEEVVIECLQDHAILGPVLAELKRTTAHWSEAKLITKLFD